MAKRSKEKKREKEHKSALIAEKIARRANRASRDMAKRLKEKRSIGGSMAKRSKEKKSIRALWLQKKLRAELTEPAEIFG